LLKLLNAPFDWASLGLTWALLRRGLELGGWWPRRRRALFDGIEAHPAAPEYWWVNALLLSSMIPSFINLAISGMAFTRGIPWLARRFRPGKKPNANFVGKSLPQATCSSWKRQAVRRHATFTARCLAEADEAEFVELLPRFLGGFDDGRERDVGARVQIEDETSSSGNVQFNKAVRR
jgi:hypothetical protein